MGRRYIFRSRDERWPHSRVAELVQCCLSCNVFRYPGFPLQLQVIHPLSRQQLVTRANMTLLIYQTFIHVLEFFFARTFFFVAVKLEHIQYVHVHVG